MKTIVDTVLFKCPRDLELCFPAMAVLQTFVNDYDQKMKNNDVSRGTVTFKLRYVVSINPDHWALFDKLGLVLTHRPVGLNIPVHADMVVDFTEEKIAELGGTIGDQHLCQLYGKMCGISCSPLPRIVKMMVKLRDPSWVLIGSPEGRLEAANVAGDYPTITPEELLERREAQDITGVIGMAGWETYLASALGLCVIELLPVDRPRFPVRERFLSKFSNPGYRVVDLGEDDPRRQVWQARTNLEAMCLYISQRVATDQKLVEEPINAG
jgi:hypothetical protein